MNRPRKSRNWDSGIRVQGQCAVGQPESRNNWRWHVANHLCKEVSPSLSLSLCKKTLQFSSPSRAHCRSVFTYTTYSCARLTSGRAESHDSSIESPLPIRIVVLLLLADDRGSIHSCFVLSTIFFLNYKHMAVILIKPQEGIVNAETFFRNFLVSLVPSPYKLGLPRTERAMRKKAREHRKI